MGRATIVKQQDAYPEIAQVKGRELVEYIHENIIGDQQPFQSPFGQRRIMYADYTASGKSLYFIEDYILTDCLPFYGNTHTVASITGSQSTAYREQARQTIADAVNATEDDCIIFTGSGVTGAINKLVTALGLKNQWKGRYKENRPVVFVGPFEHHSNLLPWRESAAQVVAIREGSPGELDYEHLEQLLVEYASRELKIGSFNGASNITGVKTDTKKVTLLLHKHGALSFWDYATCGPYVEIDMNPGSGIQEAHLHSLDAVFLSGHKFIGGPGTPGVLIVKKRFINRPIPTQPGGGTVLFVTEKDHWYLNNIVEREEGGTPDIVGSIRLGLAFQLKQRVGTDVIEQLELENVKYVNERLRKLNNIIVLGHEHDNCLPVFCFLVCNGERYLHYNLVCALLNDLFGIQARGGCHCAGPYGQRLMKISPDEMQMLAGALKHNKEILKPGSTRVSFPYFLTKEDIDYVLQCIEFVANYGHEFISCYQCNESTAQWTHWSLLKSPQCLRRKLMLQIQSAPRSATRNMPSTSELAEYREQTLQYAYGLVQQQIVNVPPFNTERYTDAEKSSRWFPFNTSRDRALVSTTGTNSTFKVDQAAENKRVSFPFSRRLCQCDTFA